MNHPHESQAAAMARTGDLPDGEQLKECVNSGQVSAAQVVAHAEAGELPEPFGFLLPTERSPAFHYMRRNDEKGMSVFSADQMRAALAAERAEVARLREALEDARNYVDATVLNTIGKTRSNYQSCLRRIDAALTAPGEKHE